MQTPTDEALREKALKRIKDKRDFATHVVTYVVINALIILIWAFVAGGGFFWPMFPIAGWGIGLFFHGLEVYRGEPTEAEINREIAHLRR
jgi:hypothetical protein